jgi:hypothetical protein
MISATKVCMLILDPTAPSAFDIQGNPDISAPNCDIQVNSNHARALHVGGSASITADHVRVVGGIDSGGSARITAITKIGAATVADPYASRTIPSYTLLPCTPVPSIAPHGTVVLAPGRYCSNIDFGSATLSLTPGIYYLDRASLSTNNGTLNCPLCVAGVTGVT